jgi:two-component system, sensor histidine kinase and response regulator
MNQEKLDWERYR